MPRNELVKKVANVFGFQHTGQKIEKKVKQHILSLLKTNSIVESSFGLELNKSVNN